MEKTKNSQEMNYSSERVYEEYHSMQNILGEQLAVAADICTQLNKNESVEEIRQAASDMEEHRFSVGILGEFKRGKSAVINSLLGESVLPEDILPCTATMNKVTWGENKSVELVMMNGSTMRIPYENLADYVTKITEESTESAQDVDYAIVHYPCSFCRNGVDIIDTPGLNDDERMTEITENVIPDLDAIMMVLVKDSPLSQSEADFVRRKLLTSDAGRMIFILNKSDTIEEQDKERILVNVKKRILSNVLLRTEKIYGKDSEEAKEARRKLQDIVVLPYSALYALNGKNLLARGKEAKADAMLRESGYPALDRALTKMLVTERGKLELARPYNLLLRTMLTARQDINSLAVGLDMDQEAFERERQSSLEIIKTQRNAKQEEVERLSKAKGRMSIELESDTRLFYDELHMKLDQTIDRAVNDRNVQQDAGELAEKIAGKVTGTMQDEIACFAERSLSRISTMIGAEMEKTAVVLDDLNNAMNSIRGSISSVKPSSGVIEGTVVDVITDSVGIFGLGGVISGWRTAGWKGALAGGTAGAAAMFLTAIGLATLGFIGLPVSVASCLAGAVVGKFVPDRIFKEEAEARRAEQVRKRIKQAVSAGIEDLKKNRELEKWVKDTLESRINSVIESLEKECERVLQETEKMLETIETQIKDSADEKAAKKESYKEMMNTCDSILEKTGAVKSYIASDDKQ